MLNRDQSCSWSLPDPGLEKKKKRKKRQNKQTSFLPARVRELAVSSREPVLLFTSAPAVAHSALCSPFSSGSWLLFTLCSYGFSEGLLPAFFPTYLALGLILLLQHSCHLILKKAELLIYLLQECLPLGRVQKATLHQNLRSTREELRWGGQSAGEHTSILHISLWGVLTSHPTGTRNLTSHPVPPPQSTQHPQPRNPPVLLRSSSHYPLTLGS